MRDSSIKVHLPLLTSLNTLFISQILGRLNLKMLQIEKFSGLVILYVMKTPLGRSFCEVNLW